MNTKVAIVSVVAILAVAGVATYLVKPDLFAASKPVVIDPEMERVIKARQNGYQEMGAAFKMVRDELKSGTPMKSMLDRASAQVHMYAKQQVNLFPAGSGPGSGVDTEARDEIWTNNADFQQRLNELITASEQLVAASAAGPGEAFTRQVEAVGAVCKQCHDRYREEK